MRPRDTVAANIEFRCEDRIGFNFIVTEGRLNDLAHAGLDSLPATREWTDGEFDYCTDIWGNTWHRVHGMSRGGEVRKPVLAQWRDLDRLELPDLARPECFESARALVRSGTDRFRIGGLPGWPFAICRNMRTMETYFVDLIAERDRIDVLHDRITSLLEQVIAGYGNAGLDGVMFCEDLGVQDRTLMSPNMWRDIFRPLYEPLTARAHAFGMKVIQHSCGCNRALIDDLCEAGIDCLQFDQPALYDQPVLAAKLRRHGVGLFAPCDIQKVLPTGDRDCIERETRRLVDTFRGGFIAKDYPDLHGIGVRPEWDQWAYDAFVRWGSGSQSGIHGAAPQQ